MTSTRAQVGRPNSRGRQLEASHRSDVLTGHGQLRVHATRQCRTRHGRLVPGVRGDLLAAGPRQDVVQQLRGEHAPPLMPGNPTLSQARIREAVAHSPGACPRVYLGGSGAGERCCTRVAQLRADVDLMRTWPLSCTTSSSSAATFCISLRSRRTSPRDRLKDSPTSVAAVSWACASDVPVTTAGG